MCLGRWSFFAECGCRTLFVGGMRLDMIPYARAGRRNLGTRLRYHHRTLLSYRSGAKPHHIKRSHLLLQTKTSPKSTRTIQSETNFRHIRAGALGGSSGKVREVWRVGDPLRKRVSCASKVFLTYPQKFSYSHPRQRCSRTFRRRRGRPDFRGLTPGQSRPSHRRTGKRSHSIPSRRNRGNPRSRRRSHRRRAGRRHPLRPHPLRRSPRHPRRRADFQRFPDRRPTLPHSR